MRLALMLGVLMLVGCNRDWSGPTTVTLSNDSTIDCPHGIDFSTAYQIACYTDQPGTAKALLLDLDIIKGIHMRKE